MSWLASPKFFPSIMIALSLGSAAQYALAKDWGRVIYWVSSAFLVFSITYMTK